MRTVIWDLGGTLVDTYPDVDRTLATAVHASPDAEDIAEVAQLTRRSSSLAISTLAERHLPRWRGPGRCSGRCGRAGDRIW